MKTEKGIIYLLTNEYMKDPDNGKEIVKIGITEGNTKADIEKRMKELDTTSVPQAFRCHFAILVEDYKNKEKLLHKGLDSFRVRPSREFFAVSPETVVALMKFSGGEEIKVDNEMIGDAGKVEEKPPRKEKFSFNAVGIKPGEEIVFTRDESKKCIVAEDGKHLKYEGKEYRLNAMAERFMKDAGYNWVHYRGVLFLKYNDEILEDLRDRINESKYKDDEE